MGSVAKKFDKTWNLVTFNKDRNGSMESQLFIEVTGQSNFDDILSNTSSDESECYSKPQTADSNGGCDLDEETEDGGEFGQNTLTEMQDDQSEEIPSRIRLSEFLSSIRTGASNLKTWQVMVLTSSTTVLIYYIVQQLWYSFALRQHDYRNGVSNIVVDVPGSAKDTQVVFDNMELAAPFEMFGTKKFLVDFEKKVAYPISSPEDFVLTEVGTHIASRLVGYQLNFLYRFHYQYLPELAHKYKVFKGHVTHGFESTGTMFGFTIFPSCMSSLKKVGAAGDGVVNFMMKYFHLTFKVVEGSYDEVVHAFDVLAHGWERTIMPFPRNSVQFLADKTYIIIRTFSAVNWDSIDRWFSKKWFLVSKQAYRYFRIFKFSFPEN